MQAVRKEATNFHSGLLSPLKRAEIEVRIRHLFFQVAERKSVAVCDVPEDARKLAYFRIFTSESAAFAPWLATHVASLPSLLSVRCPVPTCPDDTVI